MVIATLGNPDDDTVMVCAMDGTGAGGGFVLLVEVTSRAEGAGVAVLLDGRKALFALGGELWETDGTASRTQRRRVVSEEGDLR